MPVATGDTPNASTNLKRSILFKIIGFAALIVLFNIFPHRVGIWLSFSDPSSFVPLFAPALGMYLPWLNLWWGLSLALNVAYLALDPAAPRYEHWRRVVGWADLGTSILGALILFRLITRNLVNGADFKWIVEQGRASAAMVRFDSRVVLPLSALVKFILALSLISLVVACGEKLHQLLAKKNAQTPSKIQVLASAANSRRDC